jgi:NADH:ubiquinone oxidoreductase subunit E
MEKHKEEVLENIYLKFVEKKENLIVVLQDIQGEFGYIPEDALFWFSEKSGVPASTFYGVVTFFNKFYLEPRGKNIITACCGAACQAKGAGQVISTTRKELSLKPKESTTKDMLFTLEEVNCVGACSLAPVVIINDKLISNMTPDQMVKNINSFREQKSE